VKSPSQLLRQIEEWEMDPDGAVFIDHEEGALYLCETYWRGLVSGKSYSCLHEATLPSEAFFRAARGRELQALEQMTIGGMQ
jgi:hypothetical protein